MGASPFTFYRGGAAIMAADLAPTPVSGFWVQACGDAHLSNFGAFASPRRDLVVDINDFDETLPGPWEWDLKRLAAIARDRRPRPRLRPQAAAGDSDHRRPRVPDDDAASGGAHQPRRLVPAGRAGDAARADVPGREQAGAEDLRQDGRQGPAQDPDAGVLEADRGRRRRASDRQRSAGTGPARAGVRGQIWRGSPTSASARSSPSTARRSAPTAGTCSTATATSTQPARWWASAASAPAPGSRCSSAAMRVTRCSCR